MKTGCHRRLCGSEPGKALDLIAVQGARLGCRLGDGLGWTTLAGTWHSPGACHQLVRSQQPVLLGKQGLAPAPATETVLEPLQRTWPRLALINQAVSRVNRGEPGLWGCLTL